MMDGNKAFKMLEKMTEEERAGVFFLSCHDKWVFCNEYDALLEWDDESNENLSAVTGCEEGDAPDPDKVFTKEEMTEILHDALRDALDTDQCYDFSDQINTNIQRGIARLLEKKAGKQVIECVEDGRKYSRRELLDEMRAKQDDGAIDAE